MVCPYTKKARPALSQTQIIGNTCKSVPGKHTSVTSHTVSRSTLLEKSNELYSNVRYFPSVHTWDSVDCLSRLSITIAIGVAIVTAPVATGITIIIVSVRKNSRQPYLPHAAKQTRQQQHDGISRDKKKNARQLVCPEPRCGCLYRTALFLSLCPSCAWFSPAGVGCRVHITNHPFTVRKYHHHGS